MVKFLFKSKFLGFVEAPVGVFFNEIEWIWMGFTYPQLYSFLNSQNTDQRTKNITTFFKHSIIKTK